MTHTDSYCGVFRSALTPGNSSSLSPRSTKRPIFITLAIEGESRKFIFIFYSIVISRHMYLQWKRAEIKGISRKWHIHSFDSAAIFFQSTFFFLGEHSLLEMATSEWVREREREWEQLSRVCYLLISSNHQKWSERQKGLKRTRTSCVCACVWE